MVRVEVIGEIGGVSFDPDDETVVLNGEYGRFEFEADQETRGLIREAFEKIEEGR